MISQYRCATCNHYKLNGCIALAKDTSLITIVGCVSHSDFESQKNSLINLIDTFIKDAIKICDEPHGKLSNKDKVHGMKTAFVIMEGFVNQCRTPEGLEHLKKGES